MTDAVHSLGQRFKALASQAVQAANGEIDDIVQSGDLDTERIEHLLDHMLGFCFDATMLAEFKRLCRYYYALDPVATAKQVHAYREMWDSADEFVVGGGV